MANQVNERFAEDYPQSYNAVAALRVGALPERLLSAYLRVMPGGAAWLQAAVGTQIGQVARRAAAGARLLVDAMDAYMALPAEEAAEVDNDVARGDLVALGEHHRVVAALSARGAELCAACEALLEDVLRAAPAAPGALRRLARCLLPPASSAAPRRPPSSRAAAAHAPPHTRRAAAHACRRGHAARTDDGHGSHPEPARRPRN